MLLEQRFARESRPSRYKEKEILGSCSVAKLDSAWLLRTDTMLASYALAFASTVFFFFSHNARQAGNEVKKARRDGLAVDSPFTRAFAALEPYLSESALNFGGVALEEGKVRVGSWLSGATSER